MKSVFIKNEATHLLHYLEVILSLSINISILSSELQNQSRRCREPPLFPYRLESGYYPAFFPLLLDFSQLSKTQRMRQIKRQ